MGPDAVKASIDNWLWYAEHPNGREDRKTALRYIDELIEILASETFDQVQGRDAYLAQKREQRRAL